MPFRMEVGPRDVDGGAFVLKKRLDRSKENVQLGTVSADWLRGQLDAVQKAMFEKARAFRDANLKTAASYDELKSAVEAGGFVRAWFTPNRENEAKIKEETKATVRCIPFDQPGGSGKDIFSGQETQTQVIFAQSY